MTDRDPTILGAIDAGSNAIRMSIARLSPGGELEPIESDRQPVRLGRHTFTRGALDTRTIEAAVAAFARFRKIFDRHKVGRYRAVGTSALRNASNREDLIDRLYREFDLELEVIDGEEEARLVRAAVLHALTGRTPPTMIVDLGGGSLEVSERTRDEWITSSMKIGTVRMLETFGLTGAIADGEARMIRRYVSSTLRSSLPEELWEPSITTAVTCGGNAEALAALFGDKGRIPTVKLSALEAALPELLAADVPTRMKRYGVRQDRAEVMAVAALIFVELGKTLHLKRMEVPGVGVRDGVLLDLRDAGEREPTALASARGFAARLGHNTEHAEQVRRLATALFSARAPERGRAPRSGTLLQIAALLHDLGEVIHRRSHHKHSEYLILNGRLAGLAELEREVIAAVARAHRKSLPDKRHLTFSALPEERQDEVRALAALLRVADALDGDHRQRVLGLRTELKSKKLVLGLSVAPDDDTLSLTDMTKGSELERLLGRKLVFEVEKAPKPRARAAHSE